VEKQETVKSEKLKELEDDLERIANQPFETKEQLKERIKELSDNEQKVEKLQEERANKDKRLQEQLKALDRLAKKDSEGPADKMRDALSKGDFNKAKEELDRLRKKMKQKEEEGGLNKEQQEKLQKQLSELQDQLQRLSRQEAKRQELDRLQREGKIDKETLDRELDQLNLDLDKLKDLEQLARDLEEYKKSMEKGDQQQAEEALDRLAEQMEKMDGDSQEGKELMEKLQKVRAAKEASCRGMCKKDGKDGEPKDSPGNNQPTPASGRRPESKTGDTKSVDQRERAQLDTRGQVILGGFAPGQNYKKKPAKEVEADIRQASQEAAEAMERQNIPREARDLTRGYFRNLDGNRTPK
jgi:septal ring factor EnvC (AmiA/AmiB activator)